MTNVSCFHSQHFLCSEPGGGGGGGGRESYPDIKLIHKMLTDNLLSIIGVNNHRKEIILFSKTFL